LVLVKDIIESYQRMNASVTLALWFKKTSVSQTLNMLRSRRVTLETSLSITKTRQLVATALLNHGWVLVESTASVQLSAILVKVISRLTKHPQMVHSESTTLHSQQKRVWPLMQAIQKVPMALIW
jgi:hypothetical protein